MGVVSSYCQICGLPVQHDHYVRGAAESHWLIWRGREESGFGPAVAFGPEHEWLRAAVGLRLDDSEPQVIVEGGVHDGVFQCAGSGTFVWDGLDERAALHRFCWEVAGSPGTWEPLADLELPQEQEPYRQQLFDFETFVADGHGWMLTDPAGDTDEARRSRRRITDLLAVAG